MSKTAEEGFGLLQYQIELVESILRHPAVLEDTHGRKAVLSSTLVDSRLERVRIDTSAVVDDCWRIVASLVTFVDAAVSNSVGDDRKTALPTVLIESVARVACLPNQFQDLHALVGSEIPPETKETMRLPLQYRLADLMHRPSLTDLLVDVRVVRSA